MAWQSEMVRMLRHVVNDLDSSSYSFTDDRLEESILVSAQLVLTEIDFENTYTVDVDGLVLTPDPTTLADKDDAFINIDSGFRVIWETSTTRVWRRGVML